MHFSTGVKWNFNWFFLLFIKHHACKISFHACKIPVASNIFLITVSPTKGCCNKEDRYIWVTGPLHSKQQCPGQICLRICVWDFLCPGHFCTNICINIFIRLLFYFKNAKWSWTRSIGYITWGLCPVIVEYHTYECPGTPVTRTHLTRTESSCT